MKKTIYLDNNATTAVDPKVIDEITLSLNTLIGNPSSSHFFGQKAKNRLQKARDDIARYLKCQSREIIFTSGATEALNILLQSIPPGHIISSDVEHAATYTTLKRMNRDVTFVNTGRQGAVNLSAIKQALKPNTLAIVLMAVNNETGVKTNISEIAEFTKSLNILFIVDGVAILGKETFAIPEGVSAMSFSGHKLHAPKGIGFAYVNRSFKLKPYLTGGDQEFGIRGGTENMMGIIGLQKAISLLNDLTPASKEMERLRDKIESTLLENLPNVSINGEGNRVVNTSNLCFHGIDGEALLAKLDAEGIAVSLGSACASGALEPSRILLNMGLSMEDASSSIRISLSRFTTEEEIDYASSAIISIVHQLKP